MYVLTHVCMYMYMVHIYIYIYMYMYIYIHIYTYTYKCMFGYMYVCVHAHVHTVHAYQNVYNISIWADLPWRKHTLSKYFTWIITKRLTSVGTGVGGVVGLCGIVVRNVHSFHVKVDQCIQACTDTRVTCTMLCVSALCKHMRVGGDLTEAGTRLRRELDCITSNNSQNLWYGIKQPWCYLAWLLCTCMQLLLHDLLVLVPMLGMA
jgi:hypothetical protein